jgi:hypothetical protein
MQLHKENASANLQVYCYRAEAPEDGGKMENIRKGEK